MHIQPLKKVTFHVKKVLNFTLFPVILIVLSQNDFLFDCHIIILL